MMPVFIYPLALSMRTVTTWLSFFSSWLSWGGSNGWGFSCKSRCVPAVRHAWRAASGATAAGAVARAYPAPARPAPGRR